MIRQNVLNISRAFTGMILLSASFLVQAGQWVVIAAEQASLQPGALVDDSKRLTLTEGAQLTLLAEDGKILKLTGPYTSVPTHEGPTTGQASNLAAIADLLQGHQASTSTLGVMRNSRLRTPSNADLIDTDTSGERCLQGDPIVLWRGNSAKTEQVALSNAQGAPIAHLSWPAGQSQLAVPSQNFDQGNDYLLQRGNKSVSLRVHKMPTSAADNPAARAAWMAQSGCKAQALHVLQAL